MRALKRYEKIVCYFNTDEKITGVMLLTGCPMD